MLGLATLLVCAVATAASAHAADARVEQAVLLDGTTMTAGLHDFTADGIVLKREDAQQQEVPLDKLLRWGARRDWSGGPLIVLDDGWLMADVVEHRADELLVHSRLWGELRVPRTSISGVIYTPPLEQLARDRLILDIQSYDGTADQLLLENGDRLSGQLLGSAAEQRGEQLQWKLEVGQIPVPVEKIVALTLANRASIAGDRLQSATQLGFEDGTWLHVQKMQQLARDTWRLTLLSGLSVETDVATLRDELVLYRRSSPQVTYLSDAPSASYRHVPYLETDWPYQADRNVRGGLLRVGDRLYSKGLGVHSAARLAYELSEDDAWFAAELAIDQLAGEAGSVVVRVFIDDGSGRWQRGYESSVLRGGMPAQPVSVDVRGAKRLAIIVEFADRADVLDYTDLLEARIVRSTR